MRRAAVRGLAIVALTAALLGGNTWRNWARMTLGQDTPQARAALLAPAWRIVPAEAAQGAVLLSGCDGVQDNMARWAEVLYARTGRSAMILDSHGSRGLDRLESWRLVCAGQLLPGAERAGDLAVALAQSPDGGQTILGASHGGWTALEFLRLARSGLVPPGLAAWPAPPGRLLARVGQVVLLYPYCGFLNRAGTGDWTGMPPILLIAAERDSIVSTPDCLALADRLRASGARIEVVVMAGADHGFDQKDKAALSALTYDPAATGAAEAAVAAFLTKPPE
ncbi:dienelactone hydrolase family protein [Paracoccus contaminans]|uniref:Dienelactone hydrolase domain-containing protein n=1 Tax=Paracoccus contaminans TaxID=1945662 RepID=A0A1W6CXY1_9RHOB|nr:dienelactone hydrolase family protein [Paracoccus contaminans]ARJ69737.1 hypothetical protein B0A89_08980 [Paracoccus contaminans]